MRGLSTLQEMYKQQNGKLHPSLMDYETIDYEKHYNNVNDIPEEE